MILRIRKLIEAVGKFCGQGAAGLYSADECNIKVVFRKVSVVQENLACCFFVRFLYSEGAHVCLYYFQLSDRVGYHCSHAVAESSHVSRRYTKIPSRRCRYYARDRKISDVVQVKVVY